MNKSLSTLDFNTYISYTNTALANKFDVTYRSIARHAQRHGWNMPLISVIKKRKKHD